MDDWCNWVAQIKYIAALAVLAVLAAPTDLVPIFIYLED
jgi:hypothetical protein